MNFLQNLVFLTEWESHRSSPHTVPPCPALRRDGLAWKRDYLLSGDLWLYHVRCLALFVLGLWLQATR